MMVGAIIKSRNNRTQEAGKTSRVLLFKDSFGNSFAPFLTYNYDEVPIEEVPMETMEIHIPMQAELPDFDTIPEMEPPYPSEIEPDEKTPPVYSALPDTIAVYDLPVDSVTVGGEQKPTLHNTAQWGVRDKHAGLLWGNADVTVMMEPPYPSEIEPDEKTPPV